LRQKKFRPFLKATKAKAAGETEDGEDGANDEAGEATTGGVSAEYDYLLGMAIWSLTKEKVRRVHALIRI
jgi:DNA topoisomerase-2